MNETKNADIILKLIKISTFRQLKGNELEELANIVEIVPYEDGDIIVKEGTTSQYFYAVVEGTVSVNVKNPEGEAYICVIGEGDIFGEAGIFVKVKRTANVISAGPTTIIQIDRQKLFDFFKNYPRAGMTVLMQIIYGMLKKLREVNQELAFERRSDIKQDDIDSLIADLRGDE